MVKFSEKKSSIGGFKSLGKFSFVLIVIIGILAYVFRSNDPAYRGLEQYLHSNSEISSVVGIVEKYRVLNTRYISKTPDQNRYHEYKVLISGSEGNVTFKIRAEDVGVTDEWRYSITKNYGG